MKKIFMMQMSSKPTPTGEKRSGEEDWLFFEKLMKKHLNQLGHQVNPEVIPHGKHHQAMQSADFVVYAHKRKQEVEADLFYKQMHLKKLFTIDHLGWGVDHSKMLRRPDFERVAEKDAIDFCKNRRQQFLEQGQSKFKQAPRNENLALPESFFFFPLQRPNDDTIRFHAPMSELEIMERVAQWAEHRKVHLVFKLHPFNIQDPEIIASATQLAKRSEFVHLLEGNIHDFIERSRGVIVINSGVGFESLIHGKPVMTFGNCDYQWVTLRLHENNLDQAIFYADQYSEIQQTRAWQFIYYYFFEHAFSIEPAYVDRTSQRLFNLLKKSIETLPKEVF